MGAQSQASSLEQFYILYLIYAWKTPWGTPKAEHSPTQNPSGNFTPPTDSSEIRHCYVIDSAEIICDESDQALNLLNAFSD
jgi:hypothetical protein